MKSLRKDLTYKKDWEESKHKLQSTTESVESERVKQANQLRSDRLYKQQGQGNGWDTVLTPNKGIESSEKKGQIREVWKIPLFAIFENWVK